MMARGCNPSTWKIEERGSGVQSQLGLLKLCLKTKQKQSYSQELLHNKLSVKVILEPESTVCSRPLLQLYLAVGYSGRILGMNLHLFLPWSDGRRREGCLRQLRKCPSFLSCADPTLILNDCQTLQIKWSFKVSVFVISSRKLTCHFFLQHFGFEIIIYKW